MHVPKCAGVSMSRALSASVGARNPILGDMDTTLFGTFAGYDTLALEVRRQIHLGPLPSGERHDFVAGHIAASRLFAAYPAGRFVTLMREPRIRVLSHYLFWRSTRESDLPAWGQWGARVRQARGSLSAFLSDPGLASQIDNLFTRFLTMPDSPPVDRFIARHEGAALLAAAARTLGRFDLVDYIENPRLESNIAGWLGRPFRMVRENVTPPLREHPVSLPEELAPAARQLLEARTEFDRRLWCDLVRRLSPGVDPEAEAARLFGAYLAAAERRHDPGGPGRTPAMARTPVPG